MIYIWLRATTAWEDEAVFNAQMPAGFDQKVSLWNRTFNIPYHLFRHRVRQIAQLNHAQVKRACFACWEDIPDGALVVPVDDDDWLAPTLCEALEGACRAGTEGYYWPSSFLEVPIDWRHDIGKAVRELLPFFGPKWFCNTNSYAMVKSESAKPLCTDHVRASAWFKAHRKTGALRIGQRLSLMNRTLASQTSLAYKRPPFAKTRLVLSYSRYRRLYHKAVRTGLEWSKPYQVMMADLMSELHLREDRQ